MKTLMAVVVTVCACGNVEGVTTVARAPELGASRHDLNPDGTTTGRTSAVSVDASNLRRAFTIGNGGLYGTLDRGMTWQGNVNPDGSRGPYGHGLDDGLTIFNTVAIDPYDGTNVLVLVDDDNRADATQREDGLWRSTDGGVTFVPVFTHPCGEANPIRFLDGNIRYSSDIAGLVVASLTCGFAVSHDHGASWSVVAPDHDPSTPHLIEGLDLFPAGGDFFDTPSTSDIVGFCFAPLDRSLLLAGFYDLATGDARFYETPSAIQNSGSCSFAFDPRNVNHFFVAGMGFSADREKGIYEGLQQSASVTFTDLQAPSGGIGPGHFPNGRPPVVQVHMYGSNVLRVYYHDTVDFRFEDCASTTACPIGKPADPSRPDDEHCPGFILNGPWHCLAPLHTDSSQLAFNPTTPDDPCPILLSGDGGTELSFDCGDSWEFNSGQHSLLTSDAAFSGTPTARRIWLASFDNGIASRAADGTWSFAGGDGWAADALRLFPNEHVSTDNGGDGEAAIIVVDGPGARTTSIPPLPGFVGVAIGPHFAPRYYAEHRVAAATTNAASNRVQLWSLDTSSTSPIWTALTVPLAPPAGTTVPTGGGGDIAIGGRDTQRPAPTPLDFRRTFYVIFPTSAGNQLYCITSAAGATPARGLVTPLRVWASDGDRRWAYVYDATGIYVSDPSRGPCGFSRDNLASDLATRLGTFKGSDDPEVANGNAPVTAAGFHPRGSNRAAIASVHNGILFTIDHGTSWSVSHAFPEPGSFTSKIYFDDIDPATDEILVAGTGRGVWSVHFGGGSAHYEGVVRVDHAGVLHARVVLEGENGARVPGAGAQFSIRTGQGDIALQPTQADAHGVAVLDEPLQLPPGDYELTTTFDRGPDHAQVWVRKAFTVRH